jgi:nucleoside-diphosphate kinase
MSAAETTLILLKPDCTSSRLNGEVILRFEKSGFQVVACKMMRLTDSVLREHYAHIADRPFFPEVAGFMQSAPVIAIALKGENVIAQVRDILGATDPKEAAQGTIRNLFAKDKMHNVVHASDSPENAALELQRFFTPEEIFQF